MLGLPGFTLRFEFVAGGCEIAFHPREFIVEAGELGCARGEIMVLVFKFGGITFEIFFEASAFGIL